MLSTVKAFFMAAYVDSIGKKEGKIDPSAIVGASEESEQDNAGENGNPLVSVSDKKDSTAVPATDYIVSLDRLKVIYINMYLGIRMCVVIHLCISTDFDMSLSSILIFVNFIHLQFLSDAEKEHLEMRIVRMLSNDANML